jgi:hypothetical protein
MKKSKQPTVVDKRLLVTKRETSRMLGVSVSTVTRRCDDGTFPIVKLGKRTMLRTADILRFAENGYSLPTLKRVQEGINGNE